ncbi:MAG: hypothetical protein ACREEM_29765 [Blastocatellia bacterium]
MSRRLIITLIALFCVCGGAREEGKAGAGESDRKHAVIRYAGDGSDLQKVINEAPPNATLIFDSKKQLEFSIPITIKKALTVKGLNARLPRVLGRP